MTIDEAVTRYKNNAEHERTHGNLQGCLEFKQLAEWLKDYKRLLGVIEDIKSESMDEIRVLPLVASARKKVKGKWERGYSFPDGEYVKCTICGEIIKCIYPMHYCPNCGSFMTKEG